MNECMNIFGVIDATNFVPSRCTLFLADLWVLSKSLVFDWGLMSRGSRVIPQLMSQKISRIYFSFQSIMDFRIESLKTYARMPTSNVLQVKTNWLVLDNAQTFNRVLMKCNKTRVYDTPWSFSVFRDVESRYPRTTKYYRYRTTI